MRRYLVLAIAAVVLALPASADAAPAKCVGKGMKVLQKNADIQSLRLSGQTLSWVEDGSRRTAPID